MIQQWLTLVLDLVTMALALIITGLAVKLRAVVSPGFRAWPPSRLLDSISHCKVWLSGVSLFQKIFGEVNLANGSLLGTMLETSIGEVSRVKAFSADTPSENLPIEIVVPPPNSPARGHIEIRNISASYKLIPEPTLLSV
jgi:hypothetical protein